MIFKNHLPDINFIIISEEPNYGRFKFTKNSILNNYGDKSSISCVFSKNSKENVNLYKEEVKTQIVKNKNILELINEGIKNSNKDWNLIISEGIWIKPNVDKKYSSFIESEMDILFPISYESDISGKIFNLKTNFVDCSFNGLLINKICFNKVGSFESGDLIESKLEWNLRAIEKKCIFKSILGLKLS